MPRRGLRRVVFYCVPKICPSILYSIISSTDRPTIIHWLTGLRSLMDVGVCPGSSLETETEKLSAGSCRTRSQFVLPEPSSFSGLIATSSIPVRCQKKSLKDNGDMQHGGNMSCVANGTPPVSARLRWGDGRRRLPQLLLL
jgi:hypothetical protein